MHFIILEWNHMLLQAGKQTCHRIQILFMFPTKKHKYNTKHKLNQTELA
jgi:hypothetical protein